MVLISGAVKFIETMTKYLAKFDMNGKKNRKIPNFRRKLLRKLSCMAIQEHSGSHAVTTKRL